MITLVCDSAEARKKFSGFGFRGKPTAYKSYNKTISAGFSILAAQGSMGNGLSDAPDRDMYMYPVQLFLGANLGPIRFSVMAEYMTTSQITNSAEVNNTNVTGSGISYGPKIDYYDGVQSFGIFYRAKDTYRLEKPDINATNQVYEANSGITVQYTRRLKGNLGFVIDYSQETFTKSLTSEPVKWNRAGFGLIFSNFDESISKSKRKRF